MKRNERPSGFAFGLGAGLGCLVLAGLALFGLLLLIGFWVVG